MYTSRHKIIDIGFVNNNHWVQVKLKSDCLLPPLLIIGDKIVLKMQKHGNQHMWDALDTGKTKLESHFLYVAHFPFFVYIFIM